jgi:microcystin-dependent protein
VTGGDTLAPPGAVIHFARNTAPTGWLKANGALINRTTYAALYAAIGTVFGAGDGITTFGVPDLRGEFIRGWDDSRGIDASRAFGSAQAAGIGAHTHIWSGTSGSASVDHTHSFADASSATGGRSAAHTHAIGGTTSGENVTHTHTFADSSSATGTGSANHAHTTTGYYSPGTQGDLDPGAKIFGSEDGSVAFNVASSSTGASHTHTVAVSGTTGGRSVGHTHTFSDTSGTESVDHSHTVAVSGTTGGHSATHTHIIAGTNDNNTGFTADTRPRNIALLACIKY